MMMRISPTAVAIMIWIVGLAGLYGAFALISKEVTSGNVCPKILGIPACYINGMCLLYIVVSHSRLLSDHHWLYFISAAMTLTIASVGSTGQLFGWMECPKTYSGVPMCFLSIGLFAIMMALKLYELYLLRIIQNI